ncbi:MAG TPA: hypothetical protein VHD56_10445 [Tepidisphaeraceae bacterium]|nr:hypothetical protein [Tepidisphaeraceae bacterium]
MIPLGEKPRLPQAPLQNGAEQAAIIQLLIDCASDPAVRRSSLYLIRNVRSDAVLKAAFRFIEDPDEETRQNALCCLAGNHVIDALPRILKK